MREFVLAGFTPVSLPKMTLYDDYSDRLKWLQKNVGDGINSVNPNQAHFFNWADYEWYSQAWYGYYVYYFRDERMASLFMLRFA